VFKFAGSGEGQKVFAWPFAKGNKVPEYQQRES